MKTTIVLIVGPSGAGKDTLLNSAKLELGTKMNFVNRYITRRADLNESNYYVDEYAFEILKHNSFFVSHWEAYGNFYGISKSSIKNGVNVISISRSKIKDFENIYENVLTINISASKEMLQNRLESRKREPKDIIEQRLNRVLQKTQANNLIEFDNSDTLEKGKKNFIKLLKSIQDDI